MSAPHGRHRLALKREAHYRMTRDLRGAEAASRYLVLRASGLGSLEAYGRVGAEWAEARGLVVFAKTMRDLETLGREKRERAEGLRAAEDHAAAGGVS